MDRLDIPNRYETSALLGEGGSGRVYRVWDSVRDRELALKLVTAAESAFLRREFTTLRQVRHENLIQVFDWGSLPSRDSYYTMELIEGEDWGRRMGLPQSEHDVRRILTGLLRGLAHLHCHGEVHGDLKPGNILLGRAGLVKVTDIGMGGKDSRTEGVAATPGYSAPEIWEGMPASERGDLYSVGVIAYEALTGRHPFQGKTVREVIAGQLEGWVPSPAALGIRIAPELERAVMRALERDGSLRHASADEWMEGIGITDRVGQILRGTFVNRQVAMSFSPSLARQGFASPALVCFYGEDGIGRSSVLGEIGQSVLSAGGFVISVPISSLHDTRTFANRAADQFVAGDPTENARLRDCDRWDNLVTALIDTTRSGPLIISVDGRFTNEIGPVVDLRRFARVLHAIQDSRGTPQELRIRVFAALGTEPRFAEGHERFIGLDPFDENTTKAQVEGILGRTNLPPAVFARLYALTRGIPSLVSAATFELIGTQALRRSGGRWSYDERRPVESLELSSLSDPMGQLWKRTPEGMRQTLVMLSLVRSGVTDRVLESLGLNTPATTLSYLNQLGWLKRSGNTWAVASPPLAAFVLAAIGRTSATQAATTLLSIGADELSAEDHADLLLLAGFGPEVWKRGLECARLAARRDEQQLVLERTGRLLARQDVVVPVVVKAELALLRARAMNQTGMDRDAVDLLLDPTVWASEVLPPLPLVQRARLLGVIYRTIGNVEQAKVWLQEAVRLASASGDRKEYLQSVAELTQLDWEHGTKSERELAIGMIREAISTFVDVPGLEDERAALAYGLGAGLIWNGDRAAARAALLNGLQLDCSEYWKMRITNALSSATMYLGDYEGSLEWSHAAWGHAERSGTDGFRARILANRGAVLHALGRLRESADVDLAAAEWGQRTGNPYEYEAGIAGAAINLLLLARYEDALARANEAHAAAERARNERHIAKGLELRALTHYFIGELNEAQRLVQLGQATLAKHEYLDTKPRLDWLDARIEIEKGDPERGYKKLVSVEAGLQKIQDLEDLWGVQVELYLARGRSESDPSVVALLSEVVTNAKKAGIRVAWIGGALAIGEIVTDLGLDDSEFRATIRDGLGMAEESGMLEMCWQLAYRIGLLAKREGDLRESQARFTHAIRVVKEIAAHLTPPHRASYMKTRRVSTALEAMSQHM